MFKNKQSYLINLCLMLLILVCPTSIKTQDFESVMITSPSKFKLVATNIVFAGKKISRIEDIINPTPKTHNSFKIDNRIYYGPFEQRYNSEGKGLIERNLKNNESVSYSILDLAKSVGWIKSEETSIANFLYGFSRSGKDLWMGTNGIGFIVFDTKKRVWSRYDRKTIVIPGDHTNVDFADKDFVFLTTGEFPGAAMLIYSKKSDKFLKVDYILTKLFSEFGYTTGMVQVPINHKSLSSQPYMKIDWTFMLPKVTSDNTNNSYTFEQRFAVSKTIFTLTKKQIENAFINLEKKNKILNKSVK